MNNEPQKVRKKGKSYDEESKYLQSLGIPHSYIERSYFQYKCQKFVSLSNVKLLFFYVGSFIAFFPTIMLFVITNFFTRKKSIKRELVTNEYLLTRNLIPLELSKKYESFVLVDRRNGRIDFQDLKFILGVVYKYPLSFFFLYKCMWMIAVYSYAIYTFQPEIIICSAEYSFTSSILTLYCEQKGIKHINIMHGEKKLNIREAFATFSMFYIWDKHYISLFKKLGIIAEFIVYPLKIPKVVIASNPEIYTYYLQVHDTVELKCIHQCLERLGKYKVRIHPLHPHAKLLDIFDQKHIENNVEIDIWSSIAKSKAVIAQDSTVLFQAYMLQVPVIIDDVSNPDLYCELKKRDYIMLAKQHTLLSELMI